jgi:hypothetical protein
VAVSHAAIARVFVPGGKLVRDVGRTCGAIVLPAEVLQESARNSHRAALFCEPAAMGGHTTELPILLLLLPCRDVSRNGDSGSVASLAVASVRCAAIGSDSPSGALYIRFLLRADGASAGTLRLHAGLLAVNRDADLFKNGAGNGIGTGYSDRSGVLPGGSA